MKKKVFWSIIIVSGILLISFILNTISWEKNKKTEFIGINYKLNPDPGELIINPDNNLLKKYNNYCVPNYSQLFLNKTVKGNNYFTFISYSNTNPSLLIQQTIKEYKITEKTKGEKYQSFIYQIDENYIYKYIYFCDNLKSSIIFDIVTSDTSIIAEIKKDKDYFSRRLVHI